MITLKVAEVFSLLGNIGLDGIKKILHQSICKNLMVVVNRDFIKRKKSERTDYIKNNRRM